MKKLLPLLCVAAFAASQYATSQYVFAAEGMLTKKQIRAEEKAAKKEAKAAKKDAKKAIRDKEKKRVLQIRHSNNQKNAEYRENMLDGQSMQELAQQAKLLATKSDSIVKALTTIESIMDKSKKKNFKTLKNYNISVIPVMKRPFLTMKEQMKWLSESIKLVFKGSVAMGKIKQKNTPQEIDARGNISLGLYHFLALEFFLFDLENALVSFAEFIKAHKPSISDSVAIQKAVVRLKASIDVKNRKLFSKAQDALADSITQFKSACDDLSLDKANDNTLKELGAYKFYLARLDKSVERFSSFLDAFETWLSANDATQLQDLATECRKSLANKGHDVRESEEEEMAAEYDESYLDAEEDDDTEQQSRPLRSTGRTRIAAPSRTRTQRSII